MVSNNKMPNRIKQKILRKAPIVTSSVNLGRRFGDFSEYDISSRAYKNILVYIQKGLSTHSELIKGVLKPILQMQSDAAIKYKIIPFTFGISELPFYNGKYFDINYKPSIIKISKVILELSGEKKSQNPAIISKLFPKSTIANSYSGGKIGIKKKEDILIVIGKKGEVFFNESIKEKVEKFRKQILFVEIENENVNWYFYDYQPEYKIKEIDIMIKRNFSDKNFQRIKRDFSFLTKMIQNTNGEFDFAIRDNYFNIYYKGNSLIKVKPIRNDDYQISIHNKFFNGTEAENPKYYKSINNEIETYRVVIVSKKQLHPFLQKKHLLKFASKIKLVNNGEEINFEQALITDNLNRENWIIIDRQVTDKDLKGKRLDLLALQKVEDNKYKFIILEVKLGNNKELENDVAIQLATYVSHIDIHFDDYKNCYEKHYEQKKKLGLFTKPSLGKIEIVKPVEGKIIVGGYSGLAKDKINQLLSNHPELKKKIITFYNEL